MMPATTTAGGMYFAMPDVCLTPAPPAPPVPVPYPNIAQVAATVGFVPTVMVENRPIVAEGSKVPMSSGDEAGVNGGVMSGVNMNQVAPKLFSSKVLAKGKKVAFLTSITGHNGTNANAPAGAQIVPSQAKVLVAM